MIKLIQDISSWLNTTHTGILQDMAHHGLKSYTSNLQFGPERPSCNFLPIMSTFSKSGLISSISLERWSCNVYLHLHTLINFTGNGGNRLLLVSVQKSKRKRGSMFYYNSVNKNLSSNLNFLDIFESRFCSQVYRSPLLNDNKIFINIICSFTVNHSYGMVTPNIF